jgi:hypothetical protein
MPTLLERAGRATARLRDKNLDRWAGGYARFLVRRAVTRARATLSRTADRPRHLLFAFCDHYEPLWHTRGLGPGAHAVGAERVARWVEGYPRLAAEFRDSEGFAPRHSFFFPGEEYAPEYLDRLGTLARQGFGEVELHLHHDGDTAANLRQVVAEYLRLFAGHGHLARGSDGRPRFAFIHGNWCLANARADGRWCGVDEELPLLHAAGCYADFTFPAAPDESQPGIVNRIYWPEGDLGRRRAYEHGTPARVGDRRDDRVLMIEGPLSVGLRSVRRPVPRIDAADVTARDPATPARVRGWVRQGIGVLGRPEWVFVKVHTHGTQEAQATSLLGEGGRQLHTVLTTEFNDGARWRLHYVTAREMYNIAIAAMDGYDGDPGGYRDYVLPPPPVASTPPAV